MGWMRTLLLGDIGNRLDIEDTERDIEALRRDLSRKYRVDQSQEERIETLIHENAELRLYVASLFRLLLKHNVIDQSEVDQMLRVIDMEDGERDNGHSGPLL